MQSSLFTNILKSTVVLFATATLIFGVKYYDMQSKNKKLKETLILDKKTYVNDLKEIFKRYDDALVRNETGKKNVQTKIVKAQVKSNTIVLPIKKDIKNTSVKNKFTLDSLELLLKDKTENNIKLSQQVTILNHKNRELDQVNNQNEIIISSSKNLTAINVSAVGVRINDNDVLETKKHSNTDQIKVCFTLLENKAAIKGNKDLYIQIVNPNKKVVSINDNTTKSSSGLLDFSAKTNIFYDNETLDVCLFVNPNKPDIIRGDYEINIFSGIHPIGSAIFYLK